MKIKKLKRRRHLLYHGDLASDQPGAAVYEGFDYEAFKLRIQRRDTDDRTGEVNFLIRDKSNNLRYLLLYCFLPEPGEISFLSFWVNTKVLLPSGELATAGPLLDEEKASYFIMDFIQKHLKENYSLNPESLQQL